MKMEGFLIYFLWIILWGPISFFGFPQHPDFPFFATIAPIFGFLAFVIPEMWTGNSFDYIIAPWFLFWVVIVGLTLFIKKFYK